MTRRMKLPALLNRVVLFLFFMCLLVVFLYAIGNIQGFMDSTQLFLLKLSSILNLSMSAAAFFGFIQSIFSFIKRLKSSLDENNPRNNGKNHRFRFFRNAFFYVLLIVLGILSALAAIFVITVSGGNTA